MQSVDLNFRMNATGNAVPEIRKAQGAVQRLGTQIDKSNAKMRGFNNGITTMQAKSRKFAMSGVQQAGYQIGDYAVQVANGTSKMQAFGQQAPQFLQIFGPIGAIVGAGVAIVSALALAFYRSKDAAKEAEVEVVSFSNAVGRLAQIDTINLTENLSAPAKAAMSEYSALLDLMQGVAEEQRVAALSKFAEGIAPSEGIAQLQKELETARNNASALSQAVIDANEGIANASEANERRILGQLTAQKTLRDIILSIQGKTRDEAARSLSTAIEALDSAGLMTSEIRAQIQAFAEQNGLIAAVAAKANDLGENLTYDDGIMRALRLKTSDMSALFHQMVNAANDLGEHLTYDDGIMRALRLKTSDMSALFHQMVGTHAQRLQMLRDEDIVMGQLVAKSIIYAKSDLKGGRSAGPGGPGGEEKSDAAKEFERQLKEQEAFAKLQASLRSSNTSTTGSVVELSGTIDKELTPAMERLKSIQDTVSGAFASGFMSMIDGTKSVKDAFKSMASEIIKELYRIFVVKKITGMISNAIGGFGSSAPASSLRPQLRPSSFAGGGYTGNGARAGGLDGKGGYMAMIHPRETVVDHAKGQGSGVTVIQNNTFGSGVSRAEVNAMLPKMVEATKAAVADAKLRGGSYGRSFA